MSKTPFMPLWVSDFLGDTLDLDAAEIGAYMLLLMAQWNRDGNSLPDDDAKLRRVARCGRSWPRIWANISRYFNTDENGVYSKRLRLEAASVAAKREANAHNGALGGKAKALKANNANVANATNSPERNSTIPEPEPYKKEDTNVSLSYDACNRPDKFDEFWERYPRKVKKPDAKRAYEKALKKHRHDDIMFGLSKHLPALESKDTQYRPHPATWLNAEQFNDEPEQPNHNAGQQRLGNQTNGQRIDASLANAANLFGIE